MEKYLNENAYLSVKWHRLFYKKQLTNEVNNVNNSTKSSQNSKFLKFIIVNGEKMQIKNAQFFQICDLILF